MDIKRKDLADCEIEFTVTTDQKDATLAEQLALEILGKDVNVPGFRPGKAPANKIKERVGDYRLFQETLEQLIESAYRNILQQEKDIFPLTQPKVDIKNEDSLVKGEPAIEFVFTITDRPTPELPDYKKLDVPYEPPTVTPEQTQEALDNLFAQWKESQEEPSTEGTKIETASSLSEAEQKAEASTTKNNDGKDLSYLSKNKPDDEWAQILGAENLEDLTKRLEANLTLESFYISGNKFTQDILDKLFYETKVTLPKKLIEHDMDHQKEHKEEELEKVGLDLEGYAKNQNTTVNDILEKWRIGLEKEYTIEFATATIAENEKITVSDEELEAEIAASKEPNAQKLFEDPRRREHLRYLMRRDKVVRQLVEWNMPEPKESEKAAAKASADAKQD